MNRRSVLAAFGVSTLSGCLASLGASDSSDENTNSSATPAAASGCGHANEPLVPTQSLDSSNDGFELSKSAETVSVGDELRFEFRNVTDTAKVTGNRRKYAFQIESGDRWVSRTRYVRDWTAEGISHAPGDGFSWSFDVSASGLSTDHQFCGSLRPGTYRFVYWSTDPSLGTRFDVVDGESAD